MGIPSCSLLLLLVVVLPWSLAEGANETSSSSSSLRDKCKDQVDNLSGCIAYATGKVDEPSQECCVKVKELRDKNPVCLCYVIQKANCGQQAVFSMVLLIDRLVNLADACHLNGLNNVTLCPYLLDLPPGSPDMAIFNGSDTSRKSVYCEASSSVKSAQGILVAAASAIVSSILFS